MNKFNKIILSSIIIIIIIIITIIIAIIKINQKSNFTVVNGQTGGTIVVQNDWKKEESHTIFYTVQNIVNKYISFTHMNIDEISNSKVENLSELYNISTEEEKRRAIINLLDINYVKENNINISNIDNFIDVNTNTFTKCDAIEMYSKGNERIKYYAVNIEIEEIDNGKKSVKNSYFIVILDKYNATFMIRPIKGENVEIKNIKVEDDNKEIEQNNENSFSYVRLDDGQIAYKYFSNYRNLMLNNPDKAYEKLDQEYAKKRFIDINTFKSYINNNREEIEKLSVTKYLTNNEGEYTEYVCMDNYMNTYIFNVKAVNDYTVKLDTYTIKTEKFTTEYAKANEQKKVMMNIDKWIQMLNNRDYTAAYKVLDETFRNNNFGSEENFEKYMREKYPLHYKIEFLSNSEEANIYIQKIRLKDITEQNEEQKEINIIMQLKEGTDFVMSFGIE